MKMNNSIKILPLIFFTMFLTGCGSFWRGAAVGAVGYGAVDAVTTKRQLDLLEEDYNKGKIDTREYEIRKDQIKKGSIFY